MKRPFYRDPLAAAWMAKHHEMRFTKANDHVIDNFVIAGRISVSDVNPKLEGDRSFLYYIHLESLHLLEPRAGDRIAQVGLNNTWLVPSNEEPEEELRSIRNAKHLMETWPATVIQRNGVPFHWPESEEV